MDIIIILILLAIAASFGFWPAFWCFIGLVIFAAIIASN
jgi:hypothetical protein